MYIPSDQSSQTQIKFFPNKLEKQLYQRVKLGDLLKAEIIDQMQKQIKILLADGTTLQAQLESKANVYIGQEVNLKVVEVLGNQIVMEFIAEDSTLESLNSESAVGKILQELNIPIQPESEEAVHLLMQRMLPITKKNVQQMLTGLKTSHLPVEKLIAMLENELPITSNNLNQMQMYHNGEIKLQEQLLDVIDHLVSHNDLTLIKEIHKKLLTYKNTEIYNSSDSNEPTIQSSTIDLDIQYDDLDLSYHSFDIEQENTNVQPEPLNNINILNKKEIVRLKEHISEVAKELFFIRPEQLKKDNGLKLKEVNQLYKTIYEITDHLEKIEKNAVQNVIPDVYSKVKSNIEFLNIMNKYDAMIHIPLLVQNQSTHGEIYIFQKRKTTKKDFQEASVLISLDTIMLGKVEVYVQKYNKQINCQFRLDHTHSKEIVKDHIGSLKKSLNAIGYELSFVTYIDKDHSFSINEKEDIQPLTQAYRFDTKV